MIIEAPFSKHKRSTFLIWIAVCIVLAAVFAYDGYLSKYKWSGRYSFYKKHVVDKDGTATSTMSFNRKSPLFFVGAAVILGVWLLVIKNKKLTAADSEIIVDGKKKIPYDSIMKIDKTYFESKGRFTLTYKNNKGGESELKLSDGTYDNLGTILEHLVAKIS